MKPILLFLTCANQKEANKISKSLLQKGLVVCIKAMPVSSTFLWQGEIDSGKEVLLVMDSVESKFKVIENQVKKLHSYDTPVLISIPVSQTSAGITSWMKKELK